MKFSALAPQGWRLDLPDVQPDEQLRLIISTVQEMERLGYDVAWLFDHFITFPTITTRSCFEGWTLLSALARETRTIRLGTMVTCNSYRYPSVLAKMAATFDVISGGRLEFGIGAGWYEQEYIAYGIPFPPTGIRLRQLGEAVRIIKLMWTEDYPSFKGQFYSIDRAINSPKPIQRPHPPITIGGGGEKVTLRISAELADKVNFGASVEEAKTKIAALQRHCREVGRDFQEIEVQIFRTVIVGATEDSVRHKIRRFKPEDQTEEHYRSWTACGTPEQLIDLFKQYQRIGVQHIVAYFPDAVELDSLNLFASTVISELGNRCR